MFERGIDTKEFADKILNSVLYSSDISESEVGNITITLKTSEI